MSTSATLEQPTADIRRAQPLAGKYLTFLLGQEEYGLPVLQIREIIKMLDITQVPQVPHHVKGVVNLRGKVIPVVDLRLKFGFEAQGYTERTCIIVVDVASGGDTVLMGMVVDAVSEVINIGPDELEETPRFGGRVDTDYIKALAKVKGTVKILLNLDRTLGAEAGFR